MRELEDCAPLSAWLRTPRLYSRARPLEDRALLAFLGDAPTRSRASRATILAEKRWMYARSFQNGPRRQQRTPRLPDTPQRLPEMAPKRPIIGSMRPKMPPRGPKLAARGPPTGFEEAKSLIPHGFGDDLGILAFPGC
eukprot:346298-Pyramimonas_sp.AAC.1